MYMNFGQLAPFRVYGIDFISYARYLFNQIHDWRGKMNVQWKVVDQHGDDVMTADAVSRHAARERKTPRHVAEREAKLLVNVEAGDAPVFAVRCIHE